MAERPTCPACGGDDAVKRRKKQWWCYRCQAEIRTAEETQYEALPDLRLAHAHEALLHSRESLQYLADRCISRAVVEEFKLGLSGGSIEIPLRDSRGEVVSLAATKAKGKKLVLNVSKGRGVHLFPHQPRLDRPVYIVEGLWDCLAARSLGLNAYTGSGGAGTWYVEWTRRFLGAPMVNILYDVDDAGRRGARQVSESFRAEGHLASRIRVVELPLPGTKERKDLTDWIREGADEKAIRRLCSETAHEGVIVADAQDRPPGDDVPLRTLHEAGLAENAGTYSRFEAVVIAKTEDAYQLPVQMQLRCTRAFGDECNRCGLRERYAAERGTPSPVEQNIYSPIFLEQIGMPRKALDLHVRAACQIPAKCPELERDDLTSVKVWELRLTDMLRASDVEGKPTEVAAIVIGHDLRPNAKYLFTARSVSSPKDQTHTQVVYQARETEVVGAVDPKAEAAAAKVVRRKGKTSLKSWVDKLLEEAAGVTGVRERPDVHLATLLCYATPVWIADERYPNDAHRRGWGDVLIMGDTNQAKSHTVEHLQRYLGLGTLIAAKKTTTRAGVYGGMESFKGRMYVSWGIIPRLDRQLVVFDEAHGLPRDIRTALTAVRSSGRAEINMVGSQGTQMTWARTRKIWLPNLEDGRSMADYPVGVDAAAEFWTTPEDLRRTDVAVFVSRNESDPHGERRAPAWWTPEVARTTIMRAWGQLLVTVPGALVERARQLAAELSGAYSSRSTLLELNDLDGKILRLGVALANLGMVEVDDAHLAFIAEWIDHVYSTQAAGWKQISPFEKKREDMDERTAELLWGALDQMVVDVPYFCTVFSETSLLSQADFEDVAKPGWDWREVRKVLRLHGAIVPTKGNRWSATRGFVKVMLARLGGGKGR